MVKQPLNLTACKVTDENMRLAQNLKDISSQVDLSPPYTLNLINRSKYSSPRALRLDREREQEIARRNAHSELRMQQDRHRFSVSKLGNFTPFQTHVESSWEHFSPNSTKTNSTFKSR